MKDMLDTNYDWIEEKDSFNRKESGKPTKPESSVTTKKNGNEAHWSKKGTLKLVSTPGTHNTSLTVKEEKKLKVA